MIDDLNQAINMLGDGHSWLKVEYAEEVCKAFGLKLPKRLIQTYHSQKEANPTNHYKGLTIHTDKWPVSGVASLSLSDYVAEELLGEVPAAEFIGRGFGAQANASAIKRFLEEGLLPNEAVVGGK